MEVERWGEEVVEQASDTELLYKEELLGAPGRRHGIAMQSKYLSGAGKPTS